MLFHGVLITNPSGKLGGSVWSHNRGGPYVRANGTPTGGPTPEQSDMRTAMSLTVAAWHGLTPDQRELWRRFSIANPRVNRIGDTRPIGALPEFCRANVIRVYADLFLGTALLPTVNTPPANLHASTPLTPITVENIAATDTNAVVHFNTEDPWWSQSESGLLVFVAPARTPSINWFRGPWTLADVAPPGDAPTITVNLEAPAASGQRLFFKARATDQQAQLSTPVYFQVDVP